MVVLKTKNRSPGHRPLVWAQDPNWTSPQIHKSSYLGCYTRTSSFRVACWHIAITYLARLDPTHTLPCYQIDPNPNPSLCPWHTVCHPVQCPCMPRGIPPWTYGILGSWWTNLSFKEYREIAQPSPERWLTTMNVLVDLEKTLALYTSWLWDCFSPTTIDAWQNKESSLWKLGSNVQ